MCKIGDIIVVDNRIHKSRDFRINISVYRGIKF